jgi:hypothetical protein
MENTKVIKSKKSIKFIIKDENIKMPIDINHIEKNLNLKGNEKRIASCKLIGREKKILGHQIEKEFLQQYNKNSFNKSIEYGPKADTIIDKAEPICDILTEKLGITNFNVSNKSGNNIQFTLGQIPELENIVIANFTEIFIYNLFNKYLKKSHSDKPADLLVYKDIINKKWIFFNMDHIIDFITKKCIWRKLDTGRIKGDFKDNSKKGISQYITYEYRNTHKSYFLGLNGGKGKKFIELLMNNIYGIKYYCDIFTY